MIHPPQEPDVVPGRAISGVGVGVVIATAIGVLMVLSIGKCRSRHLGREWAPTVEHRHGDINTIERELFSVQAEGLEDHAREDARLGTYGWVDRAHHIAHVPIDVAIDLYVARARGGQP
jgi:hypothetical protein